MAGDIKLKYVTATTVTVTNLHSLAADNSSTAPAPGIAGWCSASVDNATNCYMDYMYGGTFTTHASNRQAGALYVYVVGALNDSGTYPAVATGTLGAEGAVAFTDPEERDSICRLLAVIIADNTASAIYAIPQTGIASLFGGQVPSDHCLFITHSLATTTAAGLASSGSALYYTPVLAQYT